METTNLTHFQLYIQITHCTDISQYCKRSHMSWEVTKLYLCPVLKCLTSNVMVAQDNHWSGFYIVKAPYHDWFMFFFEKPVTLDKYIIIQILCWIQ